MNRTEEIARNKEIATTIYEQFGGKYAQAFIGMYNILSINNGIRFQFKGSRKTNLLTIVLTPMDTYTMTFYKIEKNGCKQIEIIENAYCDDIQQYFCDFTGLRLGFSI